ncbi:MAG: GTP-binding protein [Candidatus Lokiarchaeota archaeon]|nr:GTP-binding protein [Candidatus Harpocratesius repetitus]
MAYHKILDDLLKWMFQSVGDELLAVVIVDREGLVLASLIKEGLDEELLGGIAALVEPVLKRISSEFQCGNFGTGSFDTADHRLIFCEAGPEAILVVVADAMSSIDELFPYAYLCAEKVTRILDGRPVSPVIPSFRVHTQDSTRNEDIVRILIKEGAYVLKTILGGDGSVGKTTLVNNFVDASFDKDYKATIGVSIMKKAVIFDQWGVEVRLTLFDLAGQQQFTRVRQTYFQGAKAGLLVFDVTRPETFENIEKWYNEATRIEPDIMLMLVGNKIDMENERKITKEQGKALGQKLGLPYIETSALNRDVVEEAFRTLAFLFLEKMKITEKLA